MPSRKKAQGQARKAKRASEARSSSTKSTARCTHVGEANCWSRDDRDAVVNLYCKYECKYNSVSVDSDNIGLEFRVFMNDIYDEYHQFSNSRKDLFRRMLLASGTDACVNEANEMDLTNDPYCTTLVFVYTLLLFESRDRHNGTFDSPIQEVEVSGHLNDIMACPRATAKFFHRRNSCDCLQDIYYNLKETTKRTSFCFNCKNVVDIKKLSRCEHCDIAQYCSYECALAHWPKHHEACKEFLLRKCEHYLSFLGT